MVVKYGIQVDKEIREGWTLQDFINEIDMMLWDVVMGYTYKKSPETVAELRNEIDNLIPKHMFTTQKQQNDVVNDLTTIYARKWGFEDEN